MADACFECGEPIGHADGCSRSRRFAAPAPTATATPERRSLIERINAERRNPPAGGCHHCGAARGEVHKLTCREHPDNKRAPVATPTAQPASAASEVCPVHGTKLGGKGGKRCYRCKPGTPNQAASPPEPKPTQASLVAAPAPAFPPDPEFLGRMAESYTREIAREDPPLPDRRPPSESTDEPCCAKPASAPGLSENPPPSPEVPRVPQSPVSVATEALPAPAEMRPDWAGDPEIAAIAAIARVLEGLDPRAVRRILVWAGSRAGVLHDAAGYTFAEQ